VEFRRESSRRGICVVVAALAALSLLVASRADAATAVRTIPIVSNFGFNYTLAPDDTFWVADQGQVTHLDADGDQTSGGFASNGLPYPLGVEYYNSRVYVVVYGGGSANPLVSAPVNSGDNPTTVGSDYETNNRLGPNAAAIRITPGGAGFVISGGSNKINQFDPTNLAVGHPYYPQLTSGWGINEPNYDDAMAAGFETCEGGFGPDASGCGRFTGTGGVALGHLSEPADVAVGANGSYYVLEQGNNRVTTFASGPVPTNSFGSGSANGALDSPVSMVRTNGHLYVSDSGNRRISEFDSGGGYLGSFGFGVLTGADKFETCGPTKCRVGVPTSTDQRSGFSRLDVNSDGQLYAYMPGVAEVQVIDLGGSSPAPDKITLKADPLKVKKNGKTKLSAIIKPASSCSNRSVLFEKRNSQGYDHLGGSMKVGSDCKVTKRQKITKESTFRAVSIQSDNHATVKTSSTVTVKLK
jgi:hypothetical protein